MSKVKGVPIAELKKGDKVQLHMFTGIVVGVKEVIAADKNTVTLETRKGEAKFSRKTGKQVSPEAKDPKYANFITEDDGTFVPKAGKKEEKSSKKPSSKKAKVEEVDDEDEEETPKKTSKKAKADETKKSSKKSTKKAKQVEDEEDDDDYEEMD